MNHIKNELGNQHGDFLVTEYTEKRNLMNGNVIWKCKCVHCGDVRFIDGNQLRMGRIAHCQKCNSHAHLRGRRKR